MTIKRRTSRKFYPLLALAISGTVYWGFYFTYFGPLAAGRYPPEASPAVHLHGWSFFLLCVFIVIGMFYNLVVLRSIHRVYLIGLPIVIGFFALGLGLAGTATGEVISRFVALFSRAFGFLY